MNDRNITRIAMWSGPRNISTAMMRSFENRKDTLVIDEPFYAYYLNETGLNHPLREKVLASQSINWDEIVSQLNGEIPKDKTIFYQKHMVHHILSFDNISWVKNFKNCLLIRHPKQVIVSYSKKSKINSINDLGFVQQVKLFEQIKNLTGSYPAVIDSKDILLNPKLYLLKLCNYFEISFLEEMLSWPIGQRTSDGIWGSHWYKNVINSNGFIRYKESNEGIHQDDIQFYQDSIKHYNYLSSYKL
tara:strand:- start:844 stop:1578 length:735 start_codon:yes stop_codon:yes gene_type:complete